MSLNKSFSSSIAQACDHIKKNKALIITCGAGMSVDSGLPDFRGPKGFYKCYPEFEKMNLTFNQCANPNFFSKFPKMAWYFYGHRFNLYKSTQPHDGYKKIHEIGSKLKDDNFIVITSNVDGHFLKAGYSEKKIIEIHGSINYLQCNYCQKISTVKSNGIEKFDLNETLFELKKIPKCRTCEGILRPNILMLNDSEFINERLIEQNNHFMDFMKKNSKEGITVIEIGAGIDVLNIRAIGENLLIKDEYPSCLIRINPIRESMILKEMLTKNMIDKEKYDEFLDGIEIDIEKELEEFSKDSEIELNEFLKLKSSNYLEEKNKNINYIKKLINYDKKFYEKTINSMIEIKSTALIAINELYTSLIKI